MKVLVLAGHLDDAVVAVGGTLAKIAKEGGDVAVVAFGNGSEAYGRIEDKDTIVQTFTRQAREAHEILGVRHFEPLDYTDYGVLPSERLYHDCIRYVRKYKPDIVFSHYWAEYVQHRTMARFALDGWWQAGWKASAELGEPWTAGKFYHYEVLHLLPHPSHIVDISDTLEVKLAAWKAFKVSAEFLSEVQTQTEAKARYYGSLIGVQYGEALKQSFFRPQAVADSSEL